MFRSSVCLVGLIACLLVEKWRTGTGNRSAKVMRDIGEEVRATAALQRPDCAPSIQECPVIPKSERQNGSNLTIWSKMVPAARRYATIIRI